MLTDTGVCPGDGVKGPPVARRPVWLLAEGAGLYKTIIRDRPILIIKSVFGKPSRINLCKTFSYIGRQRPYPCGDLVIGKPSSGCKGIQVLSRSIVSG